MAPQIFPGQFATFINIGFGTELIYSFVIILCSLMVYFGTKQLYELSSHKGIKYFREAFLFFAIAYFVRYFIKSILVFFSIKRLHEMTFLMFGPSGGITSFLFMYFSSMAVFYLLYSVMWKKWGNKNYGYIFHAIAAIIALIVTISNNDYILLSVNLFFFILASFVFYIAHKSSKTKKGNRLYAVYILLFAFWTLNLIDIFIPSFIQGFQLLIYLASAGIFMTILYKVLKKAGN